MKLGKHPKSQNRGTIILRDRIFGSTQLQGQNLVTTDQHLQVTEEHRLQAPQMVNPPEMNPTMMTDLLVTEDESPMIGNVVDIIREDLGGQETMMVTGMEVTDLVDHEDPAEEVLDGPEDREDQEDHRMMTLKVVDQDAEVPPVPLDHLDRLDRLEALEIMMTETL